MADALKLEVLLEATDKITGPLKKALGMSESLGDSFSKTRRQLRDLNQQSKDIESLKKLETQITDAGASVDLAKNKFARLGQQLSESKDKSVRFREELTQAKAKLEGLKEKIEATKEPSKTMIKQFGTAENQVSMLTKKLGLADSNVEKYTASLTKSGIALKKVEDRHEKYNRTADQTRKRLKDAGISTDRLADHQQDLRRQIDQTTEAFKRQSSEMAKVQQHQKQLKQMQMQRDRMLQRASNATVAGAGALHVGKRVVQGGMAPASVAMDFEEQMSKVQALTRLDKSKEGDKATFDALRQQALDLGMSTSFSASQAASAQGFLAMAGFDPEKIQKSMPGMLNLAKAAGAELGTTADIGSNILSGFRLQAEEMDRVGDVLVATFTRSNVDLSMLGESMKYAAPVAAELGVSLEETAAMAGLLGNVGIQASMAGTSMRAIFNRMASPPKDAQKALEGIDVQTTDATGNLRAIPEILAEIASKTENMGSAQRMAIFKAVAGMEAGAAMATLVAQEGAEGITKFTEILKDSGGEAARVAKVMGDNTKGLKNKMDSAWEGLMITVGSQLTPILNKVLTLTTRITNKMNAWMSQNPELASTLTKVAIAVGAVVAGVGALGVALAALVGPFAIVRYGLGSMGMKATGAIGIFSRLWKVIKFLGRGLLWVGRLLLANPIGIAVTAIAGAVYLIWKNWASIKPKLMAFWNGIKAKWGEFTGWVSGLWGKVTGFFSAGVNNIKNVFLNFTPAGLVYKHWNGIASYFQGLWGKVSGLFSSGVNAAKNAFLNFTPAGLVYKHWNGIASYFQGLWGKVSGLFTSGVNAAKNVFLNFTPAGLVYKHWNGIVPYFQGLWGKVSTGVSGFISRFTGFFTGFPDRMKTIGTDLIQGLWGGMRAKMDHVIDKVQNFAGRISSKFKSVLGIKSPSRVFMQHGADTVAGLQVGIEQASPALHQQLQQTAQLMPVPFADAANDRFSDAKISDLSTRSSSTSSTEQHNQNITITINAAQGMDEKAIADAVARKLQEIQRQQARRSRSALYDVG